MKKFSFGLAGLIPAIATSDVLHTPADGRRSGSTSFDLPRVPADGRMSGTPTGMIDGNMSDGLTDTSQSGAAQTDDIATDPSNG